MELIERPRKDDMKGQIDLILYSVTPVSWSHLSLFNWDLFTLTFNLESYLP